MNRLITVLRFYGERQRRCGGRPGQPFEEEQVTVSRTIGVALFALIASSQWPRGCVEIFSLMLRIPQPAPNTNEYSCRVRTSCEQEHSYSLPLLSGSSDSHSRYQLLFCTFISISSHFEYLFPFLPALQEHRQTLSRHISDWYNNKPTIFCENVISSHCYSLDAYDTTPTVETRHAEGNQSIATK